MEVKAQAKYIRISPRKARIVVDQIRGKKVEDARLALRFITRSAAEIVETTLNSAVANAEDQHHLRAESLVISKAYVDEGPTIKRYRPRAKGAASHINKRTCHITIIVSNGKDDEKKAKPAPKKVETERKKLLRRKLLHLKSQQQRNLQLLRSLQLRNQLQIRQQQLRKLLQQKNLLLRKLQLRRRHNGSESKSYRFQIRYYRKLA